jgi:hypothetical protein
LKKKKKYHKLNYTDKKEKWIFLIYEEIQKGSVAKSYMTKYFRISSYFFWKPFLIYDFACNHSHLNFLLYEENFVFFFISALFGKLNIHRNVEDKPMSVAELRVYQLEREQ